MSTSLFFVSLDHNEKIALVAPVGITQPNTAVDNQHQHFFAMRIVLNQRLLLLFDSTESPCTSSPMEHHQSCHAKYKLKLNFDQRSRMELHSKCSNNQLSWKKSKASNIPNFPSRKQKISTINSETKRYRYALLSHFFNLIDRHNRIGDKFSLVAVFRTCRSQYGPQYSIT